MRWLSHLKKPTKVFIIIMTFVTFLSLAIIVYLEVMNNSIFESVSHYFVGDTESEITVDEVIPYEKQEIKDDNLEEGTTEIRQEGKDGKKKIIFKITMDQDGKEINRTYVSEEITAEAVDEIIAIGTKVPASSTNSNSGQGDWSNNSSSQSSNNTSTQNIPSSNTSNNTASVYYCVILIPTGSGPTSSDAMFQLYKTNRRCNSYGLDYIVEISSGIFYSGTYAESYSGSNAPPFEGMSERRYKICKDYKGEADRKQCLEI